MYPNQALEVGLTIKSASTPIIIIIIIIIIIVIILIAVICSEAIRILVAEHRTVWDLLSQAEHEQTCNRVACDPVEFVAEYQHQTLATSEMWVRTLVMNLPLRGPGFLFDM